MFRRRSQARSTGDRCNTSGGSESRTALYSGSPLEQTYEQCYREARCWFYISTVTAIIATITTIAVVIIIVGFILLRGLTSSTFIATLASAITSMINGVVAYLIISQKRYANERLDTYADKMQRKANDEEDSEKIRRLVDIVLESHLSKEDQSNLIKEIIAQKALVTTSDLQRSRGGFTEGE
jgi:hypothetical protein